MTVPVCDLVTCVNTSICNVTTSELTLLQLSSVSKDFDRGWVRSVFDVASLPAASLNKGRMIYVQNVCGYRISDGVSWSNDFTSTQDNFVIWAWGYNTQGQVGDNTTTSRISPVSAVGGFTDWCRLSAGYRHNVAVRTNGSAWAWGQNAGTGKLGDNTTTNQSSPVSVVGGFTNWCQASAGGNLSLALTSTGCLWAWGANSNYGQLGDNTTTNRSSPVSVVGGFSDWCSTSAGAGHNAAIRRNGSIWTWGLAGSGQLGDNTTTNKSSPVSVVGDITDWCQVSAGGSHTLAVRRSGSAWAWGSGTNGRLGDNTGSASSSPVSVTGGFTDWCQVSAGRDHSVAVRTGGSAWAWGNNVNGTLGDGTTTDRFSPVTVVGGFTNWCQVIGGTFHSVAARSNGTVWSWGSNLCGQLGDNTTTGRSSPVSVVGAFTDWYQVGAGRANSVAMRSTRGFA